MTWMRNSALAVLLVMPAIAGAKGTTARIEIAQGKQLLVSIDDAAARQFNIWSGPGTEITQDGATRVPMGPGDIADWSSGVVEPPRKMRVYTVRFYCDFGHAPTSAAPSSQPCYGVRYGIDRKSRQAFVQIPPADDPQFSGNLQSIYRGIEGSWYRATAQWEQEVRPQLEAALAARAAGEWRYEDQIIYTPPSRTAVGATPVLTPKQK